MRYILLLLISGIIFYSEGTFSQGLKNNGATIVFRNNAHVTIAGTTGHYENVGAGQINNNTGSGEIHVNGNWINSGSNTVFNNDGLTVNLAGANQNIQGNPTKFYNLKLVGSGTKTMATNTFVGGISTKTGVLTVNRPLLLNSNVLTITNGATSAVTRTNPGLIVSETSSSTGNVPNPAGGNASTATNTSTVTWQTNATGSYVYPFGNAAGGDYIPITVDKSSGGANNISASTRSTAGNNNQPWPTGVTNMWSEELTLPDASVETAIDRWYVVQPSASLTANLTLSYRGAENTTSYTGGTFAMQLWDPAAGYPHNGTVFAWGVPQGTGSGVTSGVGSVTAPGVTSYGTFVLTSLTSNYGPLPVEMLDFTAQCNEPNVLIEWSTASENNSAYFVLERTRDGINWQAIAEIPAAGNSSTVTNYSFIDNSLGLSYYRLRLVDMDGEEKTYGPISVNCKSLSDNSITIFPNPTFGSFTAEITHGNEAEDAILQLLDMQGRIIEKRDVILNTGVNQYLFDISSLAKAAYTFKVISKTKYESIKVIRN